MAGVKVLAEVDPGKTIPLGWILGYDLPCRARAGKAGYPKTFVGIGMAAVRTSYRLAGNKINAGTINADSGSIPHSSWINPSFLAGINL